MHAMIESRWATGTYEMLVETGDAVIDADIGITIFATPLTLDRDADEDAPILAQVDAQGWEVGLDPENLPAFRKGLIEIGEHGLKPEQVEAEYGPELGLRVLLALYQAAQHDYWGTDLEDRPWRQPSAAAVEIMERTLDLIVVLTTRLSST
ncbi:MAG: hypothetical protein ACXVYB_00105 [Arthrobacter sp.]